MARESEFAAYRTGGRAARVSTIWAGAAASLESQRPRFFLWAPVVLGAGIAGYFALPFEPGFVLVVAPLAAFFILKLALPRGTFLSAMVSALILVALGGLVAKLRVEFVRAPVLQKNLHYAEVKGTVCRGCDMGAGEWVMVPRVGDVRSKARLVLRRDGLASESRGIDADGFLHGVIPFGKRRDAHQRGGERWRGRFERWRPDVR